MFRRTLVTLTLALAAGLSASAAVAQSWPNSVELQLAPDIPGVIAGGTMPEVVVKGLTSADDPLWIPNVGLIFSESQANRIVRLDENDKPVTFVGDLLNPLGMTLDGQGQLISIQTRPGMMGPRVVWPKGKERLIADNYEGKPFGRPNDIVADKNGGLYFTDPPGNPQGGVPPAVYYVPPGGKAIRVTDEAGRPNGLQLSFDEKILYVNDTGGIHLYAFDVQPDGRLANRRIFATYAGRTTASTPQVPVSAADGLTTDDQGRLYALTEAGIEVVSPEGRALGIIPVWCITRRCQNLGFGGPDKRTLYIAGGGTLIRIPMLARGYAGRVK
jgi:gluconolactonase